MFTCSVDRAQLALAAVSAGPNTEKDFQNMLAAAADLAAASNAVGRTASIVFLVVSPGNHPDAIWRQRFANEFQHFERLRFALVTTSIVVAGVFRIVDALAPAREGTVRSVHASFNEALHWVEKHAGHPMPILPRLFYEARAANTGESQAAPIAEDRSSDGRSARSPFGSPASTAAVGSPYRARVRSSGR